MKANMLLESAMMKANMEYITVHNQSHTQLMSYADAPVERRGYGVERRATFIIIIIIIITWGACWGVVFY